MKAVRSRRMMVGLLGFLGLLAVIIIKDKNGKVKDVIKTGPDDVIVIQPDPKDAGKGGPAPIAPKPVPPGQSPFDQLDTAAIPAAERFDWQPEGLVAVIGEHRRRSWFPIELTEHAALAVRPDGKEIAYLGVKLSLLDLESGRAREWDGEPPFTGLAYSPDGTKLLVNGRVLDLSGPKPRPVATLFDDPDGRGRVIEWSYSRDRKRMLGINPGRSLVIVDWGPDGLPKERMRIPKKFQEVCGVMHPDGVHAVVAHVKEGVGAEEVSLVDVSGTAPKVVRNLSFPGSRLVAAVENTLRPRFAIAPDGRLGAYHSGNLFRLWDISGDAPKLLATGPEGDSERIPRFSPDGKRLVLHGAQGFTVYKRPVPGEPLVTEFVSGKLSGGGQGLFTPDGKTYVTAELFGCVRLWDLSGPALLEKEPLAPQYSPEFEVTRDGQMLLAVREAPAEGTELARFRLGGRQPTDVTTEFATRDYQIDAYSLRSLPPFGSRTYQLYDPCDPKAKPRTPPKETGSGLGFVRGGNGSYGVALDYRDGKRFASVWDCDPYPPRPITESTDIGTSNPLWMTADCKHLLMSADHIVELWKIDGGKLTRADALRNTPGHLHGLAGSPDGKLILFNHGPLYDVSGGTFQKLNPVAPGDGMWCIPAFSPDGGRVAVAGTTVRVIDLKTRTVLYRWDAPGPVRRVLFAPDGRHLLTANQNGTLYVIRLDQPGK